MPPPGEPRPDDGALDGVGELAREARSTPRPRATPNPGAPSLHRLEPHRVRERGARPARRARRRRGVAARRRLERRLRQHRERAQRLARADAGVRVRRGDVSPARRRRPERAAPTSRPIARRAASCRRPPATVSRSARAAGFDVRPRVPARRRVRDSRRRAAATASASTAVGGDEDVELTLDGERAGVVGRRRSAATSRLKIPAGAHTARRRAHRAARQRRASTTCSPCSRASVGVTDRRRSTARSNATGPGDTPSRRRIFVCSPAAAERRGRVRGRDPAELATRAYRRPVGGRRSGARRRCSSSTQSGPRCTARSTRASSRRWRACSSIPQFIFRFETRAGRRAGAARPIRVSDVELASRLSFFLWSSIPDESAARGSRRAAARASRPCSSAQTRRMLADPKADALVAQLRGASGCCFGSSTTAAPASTRVRRQPARTPSHGDRAAVRERCCAKTAASSTCIDADFTFVDERLAEHYGIPNMRGSRFRRRRAHRRRAPRPAGPRQHADGDVGAEPHVAREARPVDAGESAGRARAAAAAGVETNLDETAPAGAVADVAASAPRTQHRANPSCAARRHAVMDPIGFALENFDFIGQVAGR